MASKLFDRLRRDDSALQAPTAMADGITAGPTGVWAWVVLPTRSTDELNTQEIFRLTSDGASVLRRLLPRDSEFHFKIQWGQWTGDEYVAQELQRLGRPTPAQRGYIDLGGGRITENRFPRRQVLLGIRLGSAPDRESQTVLRRAAREVEGAAGDRAAGASALRRTVDQARAWHERMAATSFAARPATVQELAWSLRRDLRRTVGWLPSRSVISAGQVTRLKASRVIPHADHVEIITDVGSSFLRMLAPAQSGFPTTDMELPGGEWLKNLTIGDDVEDLVPAPPVEVSIRGRNLSQADAAKRLREALALAKEQGREAARGVAEEPPDEITESRGVLSERLKEVRQGSVGMVADNTTWIVEAATLHELDRRTTSVIDHYGGQGITVWAPSHVQHVLWSETVLGERQRFRDCEQLRPMTTLVGGWFHGGSEVGGLVGPYLGGNIGSTPGPFRYRLTDAQLESAGVTSAFLGKTGSGKSTAVMLSVLAEVVYGAWALLTDFKGDLAGIVSVANYFGVPTTTVATSQQASGSMCPFRYVGDPGEAASRAVDNLLMMLPAYSGDSAEAIVRAAANYVAARPDRQDMSSAAIIETLRSATDPQARAIGAELSELARDPLARPVAGPHDPAARGLPTGPGLVYLRFEDLRMPGRESAQAGWKAGQRLSVMLVQAGFAYATYMAGRVKGIAKLVALTELHLITGYDFGRELVSNLARLGRALDANMLLDTQACAELTQIEGLADQLSAVYAFAVDTDREADAQAVLLGLEPEQAVRNRQKSWGKGECEARDRWRRIAPIQWDYLSEDIAAALDTRPERTAAAEEPDDDQAEVAS